MLSARKFILIVLFALSLFNVAFGEEELRIGDVSIPNLRWGQQRAIFEVTNLTEDIKFIVITCELKFSGSYVEANRTTRNSYILEPLESQILRPTIYIPGSYGSAKATVRVYDVVDTLDAILDRDMVFEQPITLNYGVPDAIASYMQDKVTLPPFVDKNPEWDNEMARMLLVLFNEGKTCGEIASMAMADTAFIEAQAEHMARQSVLLTKEKGYKPQFPVILIPEAEEEKKLADKIADSLVALVKRNMPAYDKSVYGFVASEAMSSDTMGFFNTGTIMYRKYPMVGGFLFWYDLGRAFVTRSAPFAIYDGTDLCNAFIPFYMYAVVGGEFFHGNHFYLYMSEGSSLEFYWGDRIPVIMCEEDFLSKRGTGQKASWAFTAGYETEPFIVDTALVHLGLKSLRNGADQLLTYTYDSLKEIARKHGHEKVSFGHRYWFWNLTATTALDKLVADGVLERRGNGQFRFEIMQ
jgi:hypothetical protein